jgi:hypothetical protein
VCQWVCVGWLSTCFHFPLGGGGLGCLVPGRNAVVFHRVIVFPQTVSSPWSTPPRAERTRGFASSRSTSWGRVIRRKLPERGRAGAPRSPPTSASFPASPCMRESSLRLQARGEHPSVLAPSLVRLALGQNPSWTKISQFPSPIPHLHPPPISPPSPSFLPSRVRPQCRPATVT